MLRFQLGEHEQGALPAIDLAEPVVVIGSGAAARIRLPAEAARPAHIRIDDQTWTLLAGATVDGAPRAAGDRGAIDHPTVFELGTCRVRVSVAPVDAEASPRQRTESLARELVRSLLGEGAAPSLEIERGPHVGARRALQPPESRLVIGRGDESTWVILDEDLSRVHAEIRRGWDGVTVVDLGSKNGTRLDGAKVGARPMTLHDGAALALGELVLRFRDPAERHLRGQPALAAPAAPREPASPAAATSAPSSWPFAVFTVITGLALAGLVWILAS